MHIDSLRLLFTFGPPYHMSHYRHGRVYQTEAHRKPIFKLHEDRIYHWHLSVVGFTFVLPVYSDLTLAGLEDIFDPVIKVARPLYRCYLSCQDAFPSSRLKDEWMEVVWSEACERVGGCSSPSPPMEWASSFFCQMLHDFT